MPPRAICFERALGHCEVLLVAGAAVVAQQEADREPARELGCAAQAAVFGVERLGVVGRRRVRAPRPRAVRRQRPAANCLLDLPVQRSPSSSRCRRAAARRRRDSLRSSVRKPLLAPRSPSCGREVGAAVERLAVGRQPHRHRPAASAGQRLHRRHVDGVDVGPLLAVDLDRHVVLVEERRDLGILERLLLHHVAPVAGRVADAEQHRPS